MVSPADPNTLSPFFLPINPNIAPTNARITDIYMYLKNSNDSIAVTSDAIPNAFPTVVVFGLFSSSTQ